MTLIASQNTFGLEATKLPWTFVVTRVPAQRNPILEHQRMRRRENEEMNPRSRGGNAYYTSHEQRAAETQQGLLEKENNSQLGELQAQARAARLQKAPCSID